MPVHISWPMVVGIVHPPIGGTIVGLMSMKHREPWYSTLKKPSWTPPNWIFGPVWTTLYSTLGYTSYIVWRDGGGFQKAALPLTFYGANLVLNYSWSPIFFGAQNVKLALFEIVALFGSTVAMAFVFHRVNPLAAYLNIPYIAWVGYATALNYTIYNNNRPAITASGEPKKD